MTKAGALRLAIVLAVATLAARAVADVRPATWPDQRALGAALDGPHALVAQLSARLSARGVALATPSVAVVRVTVAPAPAGLALDLVDPAGRAARRVVGDLSLAADLIESWTRPDIADPLLRQPAPALPSDWALAVDVTTLLGLASDGAFTPGLTVRGCVRLGFGCLGLAARAEGTVANTPPAGFKGAPVAALGRRGYEGLITFAGSVSLLGRALDLGAGVGAGRLITRATSAPYVATMTTTGPRGELGARLPVPLGRRLALLVELGAGFAPLAARGPTRARYFTLPAEPWAVLRGGVGLAYGTAARSAR